MTRTNLASWTTSLAAVLPMFLVGAALPRPQTADAPARVNLFDHLGDAQVTRPQGPETESPEPRVTTFSFDEQLPAGTRFGRAGDRWLEYGDEEDASATIDPAGGLEGGGLRLGPGVVEDTSRAVFLVAADGPSRVRVTGRVRLEGNPLAVSTMSREVLRVVERSRGAEGRQRFSRYARSSSSTRRASRRHDSSGWDSFDLSFVTDSGTRSLEIQLLHRTGDNAESVTRFDDLRIVEQPLSGREVVEQLRARHLPRDGRAEETPWRLRVELRAASGRQSEMRDALLLDAPATLSIPVHVPEAVTRPRLRFQYGMLPEAFGIEGDGAEIEVTFRVGADEAVHIGTVAFDPKGDRRARSWHAARFDLTAVGGREGHLEFTARDVPDSAPDAMDLVLLSGPRIEPTVGAPVTPNVLLIGVDTLRADRMSVFGYGRPTTPQLELMAAEGVRFPQARSQAPWTLPSFSSILTSTYPSRHGAGRGGHDEWTPIDPTTTSLAEILSRIGYETFGLVANGLISPRYGLDQGFEGYRSSWAMESALSDAEAVAEFVDGHTATPWLAFWHIMDPHLPYTTDRSFREAFTDPDYEGRFSGRRGSYVPFEVLDPRPGRRWFAHEGPPPAPSLSEEDLEFVNDYYDAEVAEMDAAVGRVFEALRESGQWERTIIAFIADHGEGLGDHDHFHHGYTLFDDQVHVPMILRIPGRDEGRVVERPVASIDLAPTILGALGLAPPEFFQGVDRLAANAPTGDAFFIEYPTYDSSAQKAWVQGEFKYLHDPVFHTEALYRFDIDPGETRNVLAEYPEVAQRARAEMDAFRWAQLQPGRFHLRVRGEAGRRLQVTLETDDLFDANFASRPLLPEERFVMNLERKRLELDTLLGEDGFELVFWGRGRELGLTVTLDGIPLAAGLVFGDEEKPREVPARFEFGEVPVHEGEDLLWPRPLQACLWKEAGVADLLPVVPSPEELEMLRKLGYTR